MRESKILLTKKGLIREVSLKEADPITGQSTVEIISAFKNMPVLGILVKSITPISTGKNAGAFVLDVEYLPMPHKKRIAAKKQKKKAKKIIGKKEKTLETKLVVPEIEGAEFLGDVSLPLRKVTRYIYKKGDKFYALRKGARPDKYKFAINEKNYETVLESVKAQITSPQEYENFKKAMMQTLNIAYPALRKWLLVALVKGDIVAKKEGEGKEQKVIVELKQ